MIRCMHLLQSIGRLTSTLLTLVVDAVRDVGLCLRSPAALAAENLFLRKQLAMYQERNVKPKRATHATRIALVWLSRWFDWCQVLAVVQPETPGTLRPRGRRRPCRDRATRSDRWRPGALSPL
jgi:hypothetical protein